MTEKCDIMYDNNAVGTANIRKEGLYYRFDCHCDFQVPGLHRLYAQCENRTVDLGICIPRGDSFGLSTTIPVSRLGKNKITVFAGSKNGLIQEKVIPIDQAKPFSRLEDIDYAILSGTGIMIKEVSRDQLGSDQSQEHPHK